jgi:hypothetical protein
MPRTSATLRIEYAGRTAAGTRPDPAELDIHACSIERTFDANDNAEITVYRDDWDDDVHEILNPTFDSCYVELNGQDIFGGRIRDITRGGMTVEVLLESWEIDLRQGEPASSSLHYENVVDLDIVEDAIARVPTLQTGQLEATAANVSFLYSHASPAKMLKALRESTGAEMQITPQREVDWVQRLGSDQVDIVGPVNRNITNEFSLEHKVQDAPTHLRVLGAGEGDHQFETEVVSNAYDGDETPREIWDVISNKEITSQDRLEALAGNYMDEFDASPEHIEIDADINGLDVDLGDTFPVVYEEENIDTRLRAVEVTQHIDDSGVHYSTTLSNRHLTRENTDEDMRSDVQRYNTAFEGNAVPVSDSGGRQPVNERLNYEFDVFYPSDVARELSAEIHIDGLPYRAYSGGASAGGGTFGTVSSTSNDDFEGVVDIATANNQADIHADWSTIATYPNPNWSYDADTSLVPILVTIRTVSVEYIPASFRLYNTKNDTLIPGEAGHLRGIRSDRNTPILFMDSTNLNGGQHELQAHVHGSYEDNAPYTLGLTAAGYAAGQHTHDIDLNLDPHTHNPDPGIVEFDHYPSNCQVSINNQDIEHDPVGDGNGPFDATVDIGDSLREGFNTVEISSQTLGHIRATASLDLYRQILGDED